MRRNRLLRLWAAWIALVATLGFVAPTAAFAGTLTGATFTTSGTGYAVTSARNTTYNYGFTTATAANLSRISTTVPAGTVGYNPRYLSLNGSNYNYAYTPDSPANSVTGNLDLRALVQFPSWKPSAEQSIVAKWSQYTTNGFSYLLSLKPSGQFQFAWTADGHTGPFIQLSTVSTGLPNNAKSWVRATFVANTGSGTAVDFYLSNDGTNWTQLGSEMTTGAPSSIYDSTVPLTVGNHDNGVIYAVEKSYFASVGNTISGTTISPSSCIATGVANCFNPNDYGSGTTFTSSSSQAETWTINRSGSNLPADIATDLSVSSVAGLPAGGVASYRLIDGVAIYLLPTATSIPASTPCTISLGGFTNTATAGSYSSTITTYDNSATPAVIDSATTGTLIFGPASSSTALSATIDPTFTFTVANQATACNGESNFVTSAGSPNGVALGHASISANVSGGQALTVMSNAGGGFAVYVRGAQTSQNLRSTSYNWTDVSGTYASPAALGSGEKFGYTYKDSTTSSSVTNPASATFAALTGTNQAVMGSASSSVGNACISYDAQTAASTPAGTYSATIVYVAIPVF